MEKKLVHSYICSTYIEHADLDEAIRKLQELKRTYEGNMSEETFEVPGDDEKRQWKTKRVKMVVGPWSNLTLSHDQDQYSDDFSLNLHGQRPETDHEFQERLQQEEKRKVAQEAADRKKYEELKQKFEK